MGALISIPLAASTTVISSISSCIGAAACSAFCSSIGGTIQSAIMTRIAYAFLLLFNSLLSWIALSPFIVKYIERATFGFINSKCGPEGGNCVSFASVYRINLSLGLLHLILGILLFNVKDISDPRAVLHNGWWKLKIFVYFVLLVVNFLFIPDGVFVFYGNYFAGVFMAMFIFNGLTLLVDFAHNWAETCLEKIELEELSGESDFNAGFWKKLLIGGTLLMYISSIVMTIVMYIFFGGAGCGMNQTVITFNMVFSLIISGMSVNQTIQESNPKAGLAQSSMVTIYCTYLIMTAVSSEPDDKMCNPLVRSKGTRTASIVLGAIFTFIAVAYTTTRAASNSSLFEDNRYSTELQLENDGFISSQPSERNEMRYQAIKQAVEEGSLPESALTQLSLYDDDNGDYADKSGTGVQYNYFLFHVIFFLATQYVASLLTLNLESDKVGDFVPVGRTYGIAWCRIFSSWFCFAMYGWSLLAPVYWPDRFGL